MVKNLPQKERSLFFQSVKTTHMVGMLEFILSAAKDRVNNTVPNSTFRNVSQSSQGRAPAACPLILIYCSGEAIVSDRKEKPKALTHHSRHPSRLEFKLYTNYKKATATS